MTNCNTLQHTTTHCNTLQHTVAHSNTLQHASTHCNALPAQWCSHCSNPSISKCECMWERNCTHCNTLQHTATHCTLKHTATRCNTLPAQWYRHCSKLSISKCECTQENSSAHCNTLQHTATHRNTLHHTTPHYTTLHRPTCSVIRLLLKSKYFKVRFSLRAELNAPHAFASQKPFLVEKTFSKVSSLLNLLCKMTISLTFENLLSKFKTGVQRHLHSLEMRTNSRRKKISCRENLLSIQQCTYTCVCIYMHLHICIYTGVYMCIWIYVYIYIYIYTEFTQQSARHSTYYGVAMISRLLKNVGLFCRT